MKIQVRQGVFETNSSSEHTLCIMSADQYKKWETGDIVVSEYDIANNDKFKPYTPQEAAELMKTQQYQDWFLYDYKENDKEQYDEIFLNKQKFINGYGQLDEEFTPDNNWVVLYGEIYM